MIIANESQMAKRMKFSVIGLPHYTIWHLYEPSVDDLRHMEEMEQERLAQEQEEKERADQKDTTQAKSQSNDHIVDAESKHGSAEGSGKDSKDASSDQADQAEKVEKIKSGKV